MTTRFMAPTSAGSMKVGVYSAAAPGGYQCRAGQTVDAIDADAVALSRDGWILVGGVGSTTGRAGWLAGQAAEAWASGFLAGPSGRLPLRYFDTTLGKMIFLDPIGGTNWIDPATGSGV